MKTILIMAVVLFATGSLLHAADPAKKADRPRSKTLEKYDKNGNGKLDDDELEQLKKDRQAELLKKYDKNGDGKLDKSERDAAVAEGKKSRRATDEKVKSADEKKKETGEKKKEGKKDEPKKAD